MSRKISLQHLNEHLICALCSGYFVDPVTIAECPHSFCKTCIIKFLETEKSHKCPRCDMPIHKTKPLVNMRPDKLLQDIVYKLVPGLHADEMRRRKEFYAENPPKDEEMKEFKQERDKIFFNEDDKFSISIEYFDLEIAEKARQKIKTEPVENDDGTSNKEGSSASANKRYLNCPGMVKMKHLKKFIANKYGLTEDQFIVDVIYKNEIIPEEYTLIDVAYLYNWRKDRPMQFFYRIFKKNVILLRKRKSANASEKTEKHPAKQSKTISANNTPNNNLNNNSIKSPERQPIPNIAKKPTPVAKPTPVTKQTPATITTPVATKQPGEPPKDQPQTKKPRLEQPEANMPGPPELKRQIDPPPPVTITKTPLQKPIASPLANKPAPVLTSSKTITQRPPPQHVNIQPKTKPSVEKATSSSLKMVLPITSMKQAQSPKLQSQPMSIPNTPPALQVTPAMVKPATTAKPISLPSSITVTATSKPSSVAPGLQMSASVKPQPSTTLTIKPTMVETKTTNKRKTSNDDSDEEVELMINVSASDVKKVVNEMKMNESKQKQQQLQIQQQQRVQEKQEQKLQLQQLAKPQPKPVIPPKDKPKPKVIQQHPTPPPSSVTPPPQIIKPITTYKPIQPRPANMSSNNSSGSNGSSRNTTPSKTTSSANTTPTTNIKFNTMGNKSTSMAQGMGANKGSPMQQANKFTPKNQQNLAMPNLPFQNMMKPQTTPTPVTQPMNQQQMAQTLQSLQQQQQMQQLMAFAAAQQQLQQQQQDQQSQILSFNKPGLTPPTTGAMQKAPPMFNAMSSPMLTNVGMGGGPMASLMGPAGPLMTGGTGPLMTGGGGPIPAMALQPTPLNNSGKKVMAVVDNLKQKKKLETNSASPKLQHQPFIATSVGGLINTSPMANMLVPKTTSQLTLNNAQSIMRENKIPATTTLSLKQPMTTQMKTMSSDMNMMSSQMKTMSSDMKMPPSSTTTVKFSNDVTLTQQQQQPQNQIPLSRLQLRVQEKQEMSNKTVLTTSGSIKPVSTTTAALQAFRNSASSVTKNLNGQIPNPSLMQRNRNSFQDSANTNSKDNFKTLEKMS